MEAFLHYFSKTLKMILRLLLVQQAVSDTLDVLLEHEWLLREQLKLEVPFLTLILQTIECRNEDMVEVGRSRT
jgi:hypothetical protein